MTVLAVDLGGTRMRAALVNADGRVLERAVLPTPRDAACATAVTDMARQLPGLDRASSAVVGVPGRVLYAAGRLEHAPNLPAAWVQSLTEHALAGALGLPVMLANDADLATVGEHRFGAGSGTDDMVYLTLSTGVGAGVVMAGRLLAGMRSVAEVGHAVVEMSSAERTVERLASGTALARAAAARGLPADAAQVLALVDSDPVAAEVWQRSLAAAAACVVGLAHLFCPQRIVVGGGLGRNAPGLLDALAAAVGAHGPLGLPEPVVLVRAALGDDAGLVGAAGWAAVRGLPEPLTPSAAAGQPPPLTRDTSAAATSEAYGRHQTRTLQSRDGSNEASRVVGERALLGLEPADLEAALWCPLAGRDDVDVRPRCPFDVDVLEAQDGSPVELVQRDPARGRVAHAVERCGGDGLGTPVAGASGGAVV